MRTLLVALGVTLLGMPAGSQAQEPGFGLKAGLSVADFGGERIVDSSYRNGVVIGAFASIPIGASVAIQPEVTFSQRGAGSAAYDYHDIPVDGDGPPIGVYLAETTRHDYLEIPVLVKVSPASAGSSLRPALIAGPYVGFLLNVNEVHDTDYSPYVHSRDFGFIVGGALDLGRLSFDARYGLGLTSIAKDYDASYGRIPGGVTNRGFTLTTGFLLF